MFIDHDRYEILKSRVTHLSSSIFFYITENVECAVIKSQKNYETFIQKKTSRKMTR